MGARERHPFRRWLPAHISSLQDAGVGLSAAGATKRPALTRAQSAWPTRLRLAVHFKCLKTAVPACVLCSVRCVWTFSSAELESLAGAAGSDRGCGFDHCRGTEVRAANCGARHQRSAHHALTRGACRLGSEGVWTDAAIHSGRAAQSGGGLGNSTCRTLTADPSRAS